MADFRIRKLERSSDPYDEEKLKRTQCRYNGCAQYEVRFARSYENTMRERVVYVSVKFLDEAFAIQGDVDIRMLEVNPKLLKRMIQTIADDLAVCPNCDQLSQKQDYFYEQICKHLSPILTSYYL